MDETNTCTSCNQNIDENDSSDDDTDGSTTEENAGATLHRNLTPSEREEFEARLHRTDLYLSSGRLSYDDEHVSSEMSATNIVAHRRRSSNDNHADARIRIGSLYQARIPQLLVRTIPMRIEEQKRSAQAIYPDFPVNNPSIDCSIGGLMEYRTRTMLSSRRQQIRPARTARRTRQALIASTSSDLFVEDVHDRDFFKGAINC